MRTLLFVSILIVLAASSAPGLLARYIQQSPARAGPVAEAAATAEPSQRAPRSGFEVKAERDGHFYLEAEINFRPVRMMVDTGATVVALRASDARAAGIRVTAADFTQPVQTANGTTGAAEALLDVIAIEDIEVRNVRALVIPDEKLRTSLLGGSFLHRLRRFEVSDGTLMFEN